MNAVKKLELHRLDGETVSAGCHGCPLLRQCGGYTRRGGGWSCMDRCATCTEACDLVCMKRTSDFVQAMLEVGGFHHAAIGELSGPSGLLPRYVPVLQHSVEPEVPLEWAALPLRAVMRFDQGRYKPCAGTAGELRAKFGLTASTKIVLLGTGKDRPIESYWRWRRLHEVPAALAKLDLAAAITPNYSLFLEDPRPHHLFNRKRTLLCASEWSAAGVPSVPYLQAVAEADWEYWESLLRGHPEIDVVAKEFQTGNAILERGMRTLDSLAHLQDRIGRRLHIIAVGGARYRAELTRRFDAWTIVDSVPFMRAVKRRIAAQQERRVRWDKALGDEVSDLLLHNVGVYSRWLARTVSVDTGVSHQPRRHVPWLVALPA